METQGIYILSNFGLFLIIVSLLIPLKNSSKSILRRIMNNSRPALYLGKMNPLAKYLEKLSCHGIFKHLELKDDSEKYKKYQKQIVAAGGLGGLTPNGFNITHYLVPVILLVILLLFSAIMSSTENVLNPESFMIQQKAEETITDFGSKGGIIKTRPKAPSPQNPIKKVSGLVCISLLGYFIPDLFLKSAVSKRNKKIQKELPVIETFTVLMLETGNFTVIDILKTLKDTTTIFGPYFTQCVNEYYIDPKKAIQTMADRVNNENFQAVCNGLKQAVEYEKTKTVELLSQHLDQIKKIQELRRERSIKRKPLAYVFLLALPLVCILVIWFYPWLVKAIKLINFGF